MKSINFKSAFYGSVLAAVWVTLAVGETIIIIGCAIASLTFGAVSASTRKWAEVCRFCFRISRASERMINDLGELIADQLLVCKNRYAELTKSEKEA